MAATSAQIKYHDDRPGSIKDCEYEIFGASAERFTTIVLTYWMDIKCYETNKDFVVKLHAILYEYRTFMELTDFTLNENRSFHFIINVLAPIIKFAYGVYGVCTKMFSDNFFVENADIVEAFNVLKRIIEGIDVTNTTKQSYISSNEMWVIAEKMHDEIEEAKEKIMSKLEQARDIEKEINKGLIPNPLQSNTHRECKSLITQMKKIIENIKQQKTSWLMILRKSIKHPCENCIDALETEKKTPYSETIPYYLVEHTNERDEDDPHDCVDCCRLHKKTKLVSYGFYGTNCTYELQRQFFNVEKIVNRYVYYLHAFTKEARQARSIEKTRNLSEAFPRNEQTDAWIDWLKKLSQ